MMKRLAIWFGLMGLSWAATAQQPSIVTIRLDSSYRIIIQKIGREPLDSIRRYDVDQLIREALTRQKSDTATTPVIKAGVPSSSQSNTTPSATTQAARPSIPVTPPPTRSKPAIEMTTGERGFQTNARLTGVVLDSLTGKPLAGATIVLNFRKNLTGTTTDALGRFAINLPGGTHTVVARLVGYTPARRMVRLGFNDVDITLRLLAVATQLEEVLVTTKGYDQTVRQPLLGVNQLNLKALQKLPAALGEIDLLRGLQSLPGVTSVGEASNGVNIRGGTTDQNLILLDDTPIFNPTHMFGLFSIFPPDVLGTVDIYKGNVPARFGGRAAAVLDVGLRNPNLDQFQLAGGVSFVANKLTADVPIVKGKAGLLISGRGAFTDFLLPIVSDRLKGISATFGEGLVKGFWRIGNRNTLTAMVYGSQDVFQTPLLANLPNVTGSNTSFDHYAINGMARWFTALSDRVSLQTSVIWARYVPEIRTQEVNSDNVVRLRQSMLHRQAKTNVNVQTENQKLEAGLSATHYRIEPGTLLPGQSDRVLLVTTPTENALELGTYVDYERNINARIAFSAGLRYSHFLTLGPATVRRYRPGEPRDLFSVIDSTRYGAGQISQTYGGLEPRLGLRYAFGPNASLKIGYNLMRQYIQVVTNTTTPLPTSRWKTADANIRPQVSQLITAGYFWSFKQNIYELSAEAYWRTTDDIIDYRPGADFLLQPNPETQLLQGQNRAYGLELMVSKKKGELTGWANYTYARSLNRVYNGPTIEQNINAGQFYAANFDRPHSLNASITIDVDKHNSFGFTFAYSTGRPYSAPTGFVTIDNGQYPFFGERNQARLPDYHRLDFAWNIYNPTMKNRRWQGRWAFTVYNIYGRANPYSIFFRTEDAKTNAYKLTIFGSPIPSLAYNFTFK